MKRGIAIAAGIALVVGGFVGYLVWQLQVHGAECDSTLRHCAVPREEIAFLEGAWCLAADPTGLRETIRFEPERIMVAQEGRRAGPEGRVVEARVFRSMEALVFFEHDPETGARLSGELGLRRTGEGTRQTIVGPQRVAWVRC